MSAEVCPTCEGWCCRDGSEMHTPHRVMMYHKHVCPDCEAGLAWTAYTEPAPRPVWTAEQERAAVVAWLRVQGMAPYAQSNLDYAATMIERGEHRRTGEEP